MPESGIEIAGRPLRVLLTNDDGIHARGLEALERIAAEIAGEVWVVAPETEKSGASRSLSLADPIRLRRLDERRFAVQGTPTDCVLMAVQKLMPELPDLVLSGVNRGQNIADDVTYSGTIAGAMEGTTLGIPSMALSQCYGIEAGSELRWEVAESHGARIVRQLFSAHLPADVLLNVNFPDCLPHEVEGTEITRQGRRDHKMLQVDHRVDARGRDYYWLGFRREKSNPDKGTDLRACYERRISVTPLHMDLTNLAVMDGLRNIVG